MIILLDTSSSVCRLVIVIAGIRHDYDWFADRQLAKGLLGFIEEKINGLGCNFSDIEGIGVFSGPGSFTGLRIGITVANTLSDCLGVPIVGSTGEVWEEESIEKINSGDNQIVVMPFYGSDANITTPKK